MSGDRTVQRRVELLLTHPSGTRPRQVSLVVEDAASGETLVELTLTAEQFTDMLSSRHQVVDGEVSANLHRVGRQQINETYPLPSLSGQWDATDEEKAAAVVADVPAEVLAEDHRKAVRRNRSGEWSVVIWRWLP